MKRDEYAIYVLGEILDGAVYLLPTADEAVLSLAEAVQLINKNEIARAARFHFAADRERWIRSRAWLRMLLGKWSELAPDSFDFVTAEWGKPTCPLLPALHFNLSHSGDWCALALSHEEPIGVDVEVVRSDFPSLEIAAHYFPNEEHATLVAAVDPQRTFHRLWTAKEAVMKLTGRGMHLEPRQIRIHPSAVPPESLARWEGHEAKVKTWEPHTGVIVSVARYLLSNDSNRNIHP